MPPVDEPGIESGPDSPKRVENRFERHAALMRPVLLVLVLVLFEAIAFAVVRIPGFYKEHNREPSGYYVFRNNPDKLNRTWKRMAADVDVRVDANGFIAPSPVSTEKPPGTTRIFVMGGSTAFGTVQHDSYREHDVHPRGVYTYRDSVAGQLQAYLQARRPGQRFEVITAAAVSRTLHQSLAYYLETVSRFSPDWVVSLEGFNDINHIQTGTPYADREKELRYYIDIQNTAECLDRPVPNTFCLVEGLYNRFLTEWTRGRRRPVPGYARRFDLAEHTRERYLERKPRLVAGSQRMVQTARHMGAVLRADGVRYLFVLQPMLHRTEVNKPLSEAETRLASAVSPPLYKGLPDTPETTPEAYLESMLVLRYLFDDYLGAELRREIEAGGHRYLDMNRALRRVSATPQIFTDYCHLTLDGNRFVAERIGQALLGARTRLAAR